MKMLIDLNLKEGITMVMVTHDKGLRDLASKVIRLVDGRIQKSEYIEKSVRD
jgi:ABC-type lipoprotein export system ATPase subunit